MTPQSSENLVYIPSEYGESKIVLLTKDPGCLFAYWEAGQRKKTFISEFGLELWEKSIPVLKVTNVSSNNSFFVNITEEADNWYIYVSETESLYMAELGRRVSNQFFVSLASSNYAYTPANTISVNTSSYFADYREVRKGNFNFGTGEIYRHYMESLEYISGISSPELMGSNIEKGNVNALITKGLSIEEYLGASSEVHYLVSSETHYT
ncbi:MAG TPA: DUF4912 domain-containing protein [Clostridia bacterium]